MDWKKIGKALLFPHISIMILLIPIATAFLLFSMLVIGTESIVAIISYVLAAYTLTVWCFKIPAIIEKIRVFKENNKYAVRWQSDARLRVRVSLYSALIFNIAYAVFNLFLGAKHNTFWFFSIGTYYFCLALMRLSLFLYTKKHEACSDIRAELHRYRTCGIVLLLMNTALAAMTFFMVYFGRTFIHHMITTIAMAAYTFTSLTVAIVNVVKFRKYNSPIFSASRAISFAAALVSMLTLESTMLTTFADETMKAGDSKFLLAATGSAICITVITMAIYMIAHSTHRLKTLYEDKNGEQ